MQRNSSQINSSKLIKCLEGLSEEYFDFHPHEVSVIEGAPTAHDFLRCWVSQNIPVIFKNAVSHWPAISKWNNEYLRSKLQDKNISVAITPNGYADAVVDGKFLMPEERSITFSDFIQTLIKPQTSVYYIQKQNNNLIEEFSALHDDIELHIPWATKAMGRKPDAVNFWMGDERAVTSLHKDHYENIYCVVKGKKEFILHPPVDAPWIPYKSFECGVYTNVEEDVSINYLDQKVKWIPVDPLNPDFEEYPLYKNAHKYHCIVEEGDALYLPSLWFHHVRQTHGCIAVNYWYDMDFDVKYCYFQFLQKMSNLIHNAS